MPDDRHISAFSEVDGTHNPQWSIAMMDAMDEKPLVREARAIMKSAIDPQSGDITLDIGCGTGWLVREFARLVVPNGRAIGVDRSDAMIAEAQNRAQALGLPAEFRIADAGDLPFAAGTFSGCTAERVCQHVKDAQHVIFELARVTRKGGRVVVSDADWGSTTLDAPNRSVTRRALDYFCDTIANGWVGRQHATLFANAGLIDVRVHPQVWIWRKFEDLDAWGFTETLKRAVADRVITEDEKRFLPI